MANSRLGIWLIGAKGQVAATTIVGLALLRRGLVESTGLVSQLPALQGLALPQWDDLVVGGHEIRAVPLADEALRLVQESRTLSAEHFALVRDELDEIDRRLRPGTLRGVGPIIEELATWDVPRDKSAAAAVARLQADLREFATRERLDHVVVVNVASTEPPLGCGPLPAAWNDFADLLESADCPLPASTLYAVAAMEAGCSLIDFTPSLGSSPAALGELAKIRGVCRMGCDGKTGETLLKSVLAPMFARRNLRVMSWVGHNIFGNLDGRVLNDPANKHTKVASKDHLVGDILGYRPQTHVSIEYIESLGDWKTAWDHVHFQGFLGVPMTLQFTWQGCDSILAAPLVLDLVRLTEVARRRGQTGTLTFLASFFKSPYEVEEQSYDRQFKMLEDWATQVP